MLAYIPAPWILWGIFLDVFATNISQTTGPRCTNIIKYRPQFPYFAYNQVDLGPKTEILTNPRNWPAREKKHTSISTSNPIHQPILFSNIKISRCYNPIIYLCVLKATNGCLTHPAIGK